MNTRLLALTFARISFALCLIAISVQDCMYSGLREVVLPNWPFPGVQFAAYAFSILMTLAGVWLLIAKDQRRYCSFLGTCMLALYIVGHLPFELTHNLGHMGPWTNSMKMLVFAGGAFIIAAAYPPGGSASWAGTENPVPTGLAQGKSQPLSERLIPLGPIFFGIFLIFGGIEHFVYLEFVNMLIPGYVPGHSFWTCFAGVALIGSGLSLIFKFQLRIISFLLGLMIFLWVWMLHVPRAIQFPDELQGNEWTFVFEALAFSGFAWAVWANTPSYKVKVREKTSTGFARV